MRVVCYKFIICLEHCAHDYVSVSCRCFLFNAGFYLDCVLGLIIKDCTYSCKECLDQFSFLINLTGYYVRFKCHRMHPIIWLKILVACQVISSFSPSALTAFICL
jgi:hypothetical protein